MSNIETIADFYRHKGLGQPEDAGREPGHFNAFKIEEMIIAPQPMRYRSEERR